MHSFSCSSSSHTSIPGPAGKVQNAIRRKNNKDHKSFNDLGETITTQAFIQQVVAEREAFDEDFNGQLWMSTLDYVASQGRTNDTITLEEINCGRIGEWKKIEQVVAIVKTSTPNGLGDLMLTLKDPTGTVNASLAKKDDIEKAFGVEIKVGSVLVLKKVSVCSWGSSTKHMNITLRNIFKIVTTAITDDLVAVDSEDED